MLMWKTKQTPKSSNVQNALPARVESQDKNDRLIYWQQVKVPSDLGISLDRFTSTAIEARTAEFENVKCRPLQIATPETVTSTKILGRKQPPSNSLE